MPENAESELTKYLAEAHAMEKQALKLLERAVELASDEVVAEIYHDHLLETEQHARTVARRLQARRESVSNLKDAAMEATGDGVGWMIQSVPDTAIRLATSSYAFENLEIAAYQLLIRLARVCADDETEHELAAILEDEEAAAERIAGTFDRALEVALASRSGA